MKIPYGISNFGDIRRGGYFYVDKTPFLAEIERLGPPFLLFLRPRRMGKSAFLSLLEHYYDIGRTDQFDELFKGLWVHENSTPERNQYLVLSLDFSALSTDGGPEALRESFLEMIRSRIHPLLLRYRERFPELTWLSERVGDYKTPEALLEILTTFVLVAKQRLFVLIDEYDNFANRLLSDGSQEQYESVVERTGFVRTFYAALKAGTSSGAVGRMFITGVSPLLLDDLSSGFNIASNASQDGALCSLAGFTHQDVVSAVDEFLRANPGLASRPELTDRSKLLGVLESYYDGYRFSPFAEDRIFNSDMVLYFLDQVARRRDFPTDMLDRNVRTDYRRLQRIGTLAGAGAPERRALLEAVLSEGGIETSLVQQFGVRSLSASESFLSLLYYLGMLTLAGGPTNTDLTRLQIPNRVIRELQWEHLAIMLKEQEHLTIDAGDLKKALEIMAIQGDIGPFLALFHERVLKAIGLKDLRRFDEKSIKLMLLAFISQSRLFHPLSEKEFAQGYCDLFLGVSPLHTAAKFAWLLEMKYLPAGATSAAIEKAFAAAETQVARYTSDVALVPLLTRGQSLKAGSLVFVGAKKALFRPWPREPEEKPAKRAAKKKAGRR